MTQEREIEKLFDEYWNRSDNSSSYLSPDYKKENSAFKHGFKAALALSEKMQAEKCCGNCIHFFKTTERIKPFIGNKEYSCLHACSPNYPDKNFCCSNWQKREDV